jgi:tetratricopeptide (TPR) repeat protein
LANVFLAEVEAGSPHYQAAAAYSFRALIAVSRGDAAGALHDARRAGELGREAGDPQLLLTTLPIGVMVFLLLGDAREADARLGEALDELRRLPFMGFAVTEAHHFAWPALVLGRDAELKELFARETIDSPWLHAGRAVVSGDFQRAADIFAELGTPANEAFFRLRAAEQLAGEGRRAEADEQLRAALAFYRSVRATRYIREGEALLAASA